MAYVRCLPSSRSSLDLAPACRARDSFQAARAASGLYHETPLAKEAHFLRRSLERDVRVALDEQNEEVKNYVRGFIVFLPIEQVASQTVVRLHCPTRILTHGLSEHTNSSLVKFVRLVAKALQIADSSDTIQKKACSMSNVS